ncbi:trypsin-like [Mytilus trossulus]|uniref:trypsin-like n=1 Tax=Mytilus trossulus TaxID=6551 RepID=UPI0030063277
MLLQLKTPLKFGSAINKIDLDTDIGKNYTGEVCTISGWGKTNSSDGKNKPDRLQVVSMSVVTNDHCHTGYLDIFPDKFVNKICLQEGEKDSCNEDSGGPMVCSKKLVGILNFGIAPCNGRIPSIYARVSAYTDWIKEKIKNKKKKNKKDQKSKNNQKNKKDKKSKNNRNNKNENKTNKKNNRN